MPYVKREQYLNWLTWIRLELIRINEARMTDLTGKPDYYLGFRYATHRICLLKEDHVCAKGMRDITTYVLYLKRRFNLK